MIRVLENRPLSLLEKTYIPQILRALYITLKTLFRPKVTLEYPEEKAPIPSGYRGIPTLIKTPSGREKCVACQLCEFVCPSKAIRIQPGEAPNHLAHIEKAPKSFEIDMLRCIYCGLCQDVCPEEAILLQKENTFVGHKRTAFLLSKEDLYALGGSMPDYYHKWDRKG